MDFNFLTIQLNQLDWKAFLTQRNPVAAALMSKMKIDPADRPRVKVEALYGFQGSEAEVVGKRV